MGENSRKIKTKKIVRPYVLSTIIGLFVALNSFGVAFAESGSSTGYQLQFEQNGHKGASSSYNLCGTFLSAGALGSSSSYGLYPYLACQQVTTPTPTCGNGTIDAGEQCDGANLGGATTCNDIGANIGSLGCHPVTCQYIGCITVTYGGGGGPGGIIPGPPVHQVAPEEEPEEPPFVIPPEILPQCGNGIWEVNEECDDGNLEEGDGCNSACTIEQPIEEFVPAEVIPEPAPPPRVVPPPTEEPDFIFITNDITPLLFGKFIDSDDFTVVFREKDAYRAVKIEALDEFLSFESEQALEDGIYDVFVQDNRDPLHTAYIEIKVDKEEPILEPIIEILGSHVFEDQDFEEKLILEDRKPVIKGRTDRPAMIGIYSIRDGTVKVVETDENNEFTFIPPKPLSFGLGEYRFVALYENELSKEVRVRFEVPEVCGPCRILGADLPEWVCILLLILAISSIVMAALYSCRRREREVQRKPSPKSPTARKGLLGLFSVLLSLMIVGASTVYAADTTPLFMTYNGILKDGGGSPITTTRSFRFSLWTSDDFSAGVDVDGAGAIVVGSVTYAGWMETQTITPDSTGYFEVQIGATSLDPWPNFNDTAHPYLQIEVKPSASADTAYEVINPTGTDDTDDRFDIGAEPFARNADYLDNKEIGTSADNVVVLDGSALFPMSTIPGGTNVDIFSIDADDPSDAVGIIKLTFGTVLADRTLSWDPDGVAAGDGWFNFNDDVNIAGDLTVTGGITGTIAFSNLTPRTKSIMLVPEYDGSVIEGDGTANRGRLQIDFEDLGGTAKHNFYDWRTRQGTLNDIDVVLKVKLPLDFVSFTATPFELTYQTSDGVITTNQIDVELYDTTGTAVALTGATDLASASWTTASITTGGSPTFTAGGEITFRVRLLSTSSGFARASNLKLNYTGR